MASKSNIYIDKRKQEFESALTHFTKELHELRSGRASTTMVENVQVEAYSSFMPLHQLASLSVPEPQAISIEPWDKGVLKDIEKALAKHPAGFSVLNTGDRIIIKIPPMTEENRKEVVKVLGKKAEETRISIRKIRDSIKEEIISAEKKNDITEDDRYEYLANLDNVVSDYNKRIQEQTETKEAEIMAI